MAGHEAVCSGGGACLVRTCRQKATIAAPCWLSSALLCHRLQGSSPLRPGGILLPDRGRLLRRQPGCGPAAAVLRAHSTAGPRHLQAGGWPAAHGRGVQDAGHLVGSAVLQAVLAGRIVHATGGWPQGPDSLPSHSKHILQPCRCSASPPSPTAVTLLTSSAAARRPGHRKCAPTMERVLACACCPERVQHGRALCNPSWLDYLTT